MNDIYLPVKDIPPEIIAAAKVLYNWTEMHNVEANMKIFLSFIMN